MRCPGLCCGSQSRGPGWCWEIEDVHWVVCGAVGVGVLGWMGLAAGPGVGGCAGVAETRVGSDAGVAVGAGRGVVCGGVRGWTMAAPWVTVGVWVAGVGWEVSVPCGAGMVCAGGVMGRGVGMVCRTTVGAGVGGREIIGLVA